MTKRTATICSSVSARRGAVLLEVVLALALLVGGGGVVLSTMNSCLAATRDLQLQAQAMDLAITLVSEIQMELIKPVIDVAPTPYEEEDMQDWTWEIVAEDIDQMPAMTSVRVRITHVPTAIDQDMTLLVPVTGDYR